MNFTGINLGGWLLMEGYILGGRNIPECRVKREFLKHNGKRALFDFERVFRAAYITEEDIKRIAAWGAQCIRVPFHYSLIETMPYRYSKEGVAVLKDLFRWADAHRVKVVLDLHAACGSQNHDWHADSDGKALLWEKKAFQERTLSLWGFLADAFKHEPALLGYDVLNEPVLSRERTDLLKRFYKRCVKSIRASDKEHRIFLEGNTWAQDVDFLSDVVGDRIAVSVHMYRPLDFTFQFRRGMRYPGNIGGEDWNIDTVRRHLQCYRDFADKNDTTIFVGEFGVNYRANAYGELGWVEDMLKVFKEYGFSWTYWTYKAVSNGVFPDGILQYDDNPPWVRREGPVYGMESYCRLWKEKRTAIIESWRSEANHMNERLLAVLKKHF